MSLDALLPILLPGKIQVFPAIGAVQSLYIPAQRRTSPINPNSHNECFSLEALQ